MVSVSVHVLRHKWQRHLWRSQDNYGMNTFPLSSGTWIPVTRLMWQELFPTESSCHHPWPITSSFFLKDCRNITYFIRLSCSCFKRLEGGIVRVDTFSFSISTLFNNQFVNKHSSNNLVSTHRVQRDLKIFHV